MQLWADKNRVSAADEGVFRSSPMTLVQFYVTIELARDLVFVLGKLGQVHFRDLNSRLTPFQRTFVNELRNIDAVDLQLSFLHSMMTKYDTLRGDPFADYSLETAELPSTSELDNIKDEIAQIHDRIKQLDDSHTDLELRHFKYLENQHVINAVHNFNKSSLRTDDTDEFRHFEISDDEEALLHDDIGTAGYDNAEDSNLADSFNSLSGAIALSKVAVLRKVLWRTLRGNLYFNDIPIDDLLPISTERKSDLVKKSVFIIYVHGDYLKSRVRKIVQSLEGNVYDNVNGSAKDRIESLRDLNLKINDLSSVADSTKAHIRLELLFLQEKYFEWHPMIKREAFIYEVLNEFDEDSTRRCLVGEGWIPKSEFNKIRGVLKKLVRAKMGMTHMSSSAINLSNDTLTAPGDVANDEVNPSSSPLFSIGNEFDNMDHVDDNDEDEHYDFIAVVNELATNRTPPTFHRVNKFTSGFQAIVDTYGIASYQEVNPGLATIITFPFMFAIMFGDLGHGFIVLLVALFFIKNERYYNSQRNKDEILEMAFNGRYIVLLMGAFSIYTGLMYNDIFSKPMTIFKSGWTWNFPSGYDYAKDGAISVTATRFEGRIYPFGLDWAWHGSENGLLFTNSYKMKMSVLMGYVHMNYSFMFSLVNYRFFKSRVDIIGNFIPGFLFMQSIFGYLALTIVYKWCVDWLGTQRQPPGLLNMLINMFLAPGSIEDQLYPGQKFVQLGLVSIALLCVPWLLVYKPMVLRKENNRAVDLGYRDINSHIEHVMQLQEEEEALDRIETTSDNLEQDELDILSGTFHFPNDVEPMNHNSGGHSDEEFNLMDVVIHQVIHTIEFCLNCVSHTASYLRLWALSLAHAQLSSVLWTMTIQNAFGTTGTTGVIMTVALFAMWFTLTVCILVMMEGTSAMLHSLRLHWVEAMSKFFEGEGYSYAPFTFNDIAL